MTEHTPNLDRAPTEAEIQDALDVLHRWRGGLGNYPDLSRRYDAKFKSDDRYLATLPDLQNGPESLIRGARRAIQQVGISNFRLPLTYRTRGGDRLTLETSVTGTVSLEADKKGINMSRIMRSFYRHAETLMSFEVMEAALADYIRDLEAEHARLAMSLSYPVMRESLRSGLSGYQFYNLTLEMLAGTRVLHLDYVYSSTCPCSLELSEHARRIRGRLATPHSQRSVARVSVEILPGDTLWFEDLIDLCRAAVPTETQVMVKREDEQAFAELNAANPIFVEDAVRLFAQALDKDARVGSYRVVASHQESLHSHDAVSILAHGPLFDSRTTDPHLFGSLIHGS